MRVLIFSQYYHPEGVPKPHELAEELTRRGHTVSVVTGFPHYPGGKLKAGYRLGLVKREIINRIPVVRMFEFPYHGANPLWRVINYLSFLISAPFGAFFAPRCDVIYVWHPPLTVGVAAWLISLVKRAPFVYDVQDIWGGFVVLSGMVKEGSLAVKIIRAVEKFVARRAARLIVQTQAGQNYFVTRGVEREKIAVLPNWIDETAFGENNTAEREKIRAEYGWDDEFIVMFAGNLGIVQGLDSVIAAADLLPHGAARFVFVGDGTDKARLERLAADAGGKIQFIERQPAERMPALMSAADALLVNLKKSELTKFVVPSKTVAYLASGKPLLIATGGASEDLIRAADAGLTIEPENPQALADAVEKMRKLPAAELEKFGANGKAFLHRNLSRRKIIGDYEDLLREAAKKPEVLQDKK